MKEFKSIQAGDFKVTGKIKLSEIKTEMEIQVGDDIKEEKLEKINSKLSTLQDVMYAHGRYGVLVCLQGMDTSGKDSLIREVFKEFNPRGVVVHSFKQPSNEELEHDFLWRHYIALPERGKFTIFNRSHYENVLVTRIHPELLLKENLPGIEKTGDIKKDFWKQRLEQINDFEKHLARNGTIILKFYLHLSKEEQRKRLLRRLEEQKHNWKFSPSDLKEREHWEEYMDYYEEAINETSKDEAPWFVIPADDKEMARYMVAKIIWQEMQKYDDIKEPELADDIKQEFSRFYEQLKK